MKTGFSMIKLKANVYSLIDKMKKALFFILVVIISSCTSNTMLKKPEDLIPKDTMMLLLTDLFIAKSAFIEKNTLNQRKVNYMPLVYNKYKIDSTRFASSNFYYTSKLDEYELIYKAVNEKLRARKKALEESLKNNPE